MEKILKLLCSLPVILIVLYFIPFLGICLILVRTIVYKNKSNIVTAITILVIGLLLLISNLLDNIFNFFNINIQLTNILPNDISGYSKLLITLSIILIIIAFVFQKATSKFIEFIKSYIMKQEQQNYEIAKENDLKIKEKQEKMKNTQVVICKSCGADNILTEKNGKCKYCRKELVQK